MAVKKTEEKEISLGLTFKKADAMPKAFEKGVVYYFVDEARKTFFYGDANGQAATYYGEIPEGL